MSTQNRLVERGGSGRDRRATRNSIVFAIWICLFAAAFLVGHWLLDATGWKPEGAVGVGFSLLPLIPGLVAFRAYLKLFREADEMMRKIHLEALATAFGVAFVVGMSAGLLDQMDVPKVGKADLTWSMMVVTYSVRLKMLTRKYRA